MKSTLITASAALIGLALSSCYPIPIPGPGPSQGQQQLTPEQLEAQERDRQRIAAQEAELLRQQNRLTNPNFNPNTNPNTNPLGPTDYPFASKVPGKAGFVFSPYTRQVVDARDLPSGTLVIDPTSPASDKKYFRVP